MLLVSRVKWPSNTQLLAIHVIFVTGFNLEFGIDLEFLLGASVAQWSECSPFMRLRVRFSVRTFSMLLKPSVSQHSAESRGFSPCMCSDFLPHGS